MRSAANLVWVGVAVMAICSSAAEADLINPPRPSADELVVETEIAIIQREGARWQASIVVPAGHVLGPTDYPGPSIRAGESGHVRAELIIDSNGRVGSCEIQLSSGSRFLDDRACRYSTRRARFLPAMGLDGSALGTRAMLSVRYCMATSFIERHSRWLARNPGLFEESYAQADCARSPALRAIPSSSN